MTTRAEGGEVIQLYIEMACNGMFGAASTGLISPPDPNRFFNLNEVDLAVPNKLAWELLYDFQIIFGMAKELGEDSLRGSQALFCANNIINVFIPGDDQSLRQGLKIAQEFLLSKNGDAQHEIYAIGHCHIDTAWLWPFDETIRKAARSWSSQIDLMDRYPDYKFICSQAQQYDWVKERYLPLWERIHQKVATGQFLPTGGVNRLMYKTCFKINISFIRLGLKWIRICLVENHFVDNFYMVRDFLNKILVDVVKYFGFLIHLDILHNYHN